MNHELALKCRRHAALKMYDAGITFPGTFEGCKVCESDYGNTLYLALGIPTKDGKRLRRSILLEGEYCVGFVLPGGFVAKEDDALKMVEWAIADMIRERDET